MKVPGPLVLNVLILSVKMSPHPSDSGSSTDWHISLKQSSIDAADRAMQQSRRPRKERKHSLPELVTWQVIIAAAGCRGSSCQTFRRPPQISSWRLLGSSSLGSIL